MRRASVGEAVLVAAGMARHGVRVREVWVRPGEPNASAPVRGRMVVTEGLLAAPGWRRAAILAHEAAHARLRHTTWCVVAGALAEAALAAVRVAVAPVLLRAPWSFAASALALLIAEAGVWCGVSWLQRQQELAADLWAVRRGGVAVGVYLRHLVLLGREPRRGLVDRLLATHPSPERRIAHLQGRVAGRQRPAA